MGDFIYILLSIAVVAISIYGIYLFGRFIILLVNEFFTSDNPSNIRVAAFIIIIFIIAIISTLYNPSSSH